MDSKTLGSISGSMNKIFAATTPGYVIDPSEPESTITMDTDSLNMEMAKLDISIRDLFINLCPTFEDNLMIDGDSFYRGEVENFMGYKISAPVKNADGSISPYVAFDYNNYYATD
jgi:hypothetical protein